MKSYTKKLISITSSLLIASQQNFLATPTLADDTHSEVEAYANQIGLELNSVAAEEALSDLITINDSDIKVETDDCNNVVQIDGILSDDTVDNSNDAKDIIVKASELLGIDNANREIILEDVSDNEYNIIYTFKQYYHGIEMLNSYVTIVVDKETGVADYLNSSVVSDFSINTTPNITAQQAIDTIISKYGQIACTSQKLVIYTDDNKDYKLAWAIDVDSTGGNTIYVDAFTSEILRDTFLVAAESSIDTNKITTNQFLLNPNHRILDTNEFTVSISRENGKYKLHDMNRNIYVCADPSYSFASTYFEPYEEHVVESKNYKFSDTYLEQLSVAALYNVERVYDFYDTVLDYKGADGKNSKLYIVPNIKDINGGRVYNAYAAYDALWFGEGNGNTILSYASAIDIVGHEFTHIVTRNKVDWQGCSGETRYLQEAYSDIMGEYIDPSREWQFGTDIYSSNQGNLTSFKKDTCLRDHTIRINYDSSENYSEYIGSEIIVHAAYWMDYLGIDPRIGVKIWFNSLDYLPKGDNATFNDCRNAVVKAAKKEERKSNDKDIVRKVKTAFNRVHIYDSDEMIGDLNYDGRINVQDQTILRRVVAGTKEITNDQKAQADLNFDGVINSKDSDLLSDYILERITEF